MQASDRQLAEVWNEEVGVHSCLSPPTFNSSILSHKVASILINYLTNVSLKKWLIICETNYEQLLQFQLQKTLIYHNNNKSKHSPSSLFSKGSISPTSKPTILN